MIKRIHINQHIIKDNNKTGNTNPVITIKTSNKNIYAKEVEITGNCRVIYRPEKPLDCGAKVWIETTEPIIADGVTY